MNKTLARFIVVLLGVALLSALPAWAQSSSLIGKVSDPTGAVIPGAEVSSTNLANNVTRTTTTGADGTYIFSQLQPGTYKVVVTSRGFKIWESENVQVAVALTRTLNIRLEIGTVAETVTVESPALSLNISDASLGNQLGTKQVNNLPIRARNATQLLSLQPGVVFSGESDLDSGSLDSREGAVNGSRGDQTTITLDGAVVNDQQTSRAFTTVLPVTLDSIQEFRVTTSNPDATAGRSGGAQIQFVTKSGSNDWHGGVYYFHRNDATSSNDFFNNIADQPVPKLLRHLFGFSLGGPIMQDRAYFFFNYEGRRQSEETTAQRTVPSETLKQGIFTYQLDDSVTGFSSTAPGVIPCSSVSSAATGFCRQLSGAALAAIDPGGLGANPAILSEYFPLFPVGNDPAGGFDAGLNAVGFRFNAPIAREDNPLTARFDFNLTQDGSHTLFLRGTLGDIKRDLNAPQLPGQPAARVQLDNSKGWVASYTATLSPTVTNTFRFAFTRQGLQNTGNEGAEFDIRSYSDHVSFSRGFGRKVPVYEYADTWTWIRGSHTFSMGGTIRKITNDRFSASNSFARYSVNDGFCDLLCNDAENILFNDGDPNNDPAQVSVFVRALMGLFGGPITTVDATFFSDNQGTPLPSGSLQARKFRTNDYEAFFQDNWRVTSNLTFTYGIRWSLNEPIWEQDGVQVAPIFNIEDWFNERVANMNRGVPGWQSAPFVFDLAGKANPNGRKIYAQELTNFSPRLSLAYSPDWDSGIGGFLFGGPGKSSIRAGAGIYYDRTGGSLIVSQDLLGGIGLSTGISSPVGLIGYAGISGDPTPAATFRFSGLNSLPPLSLFNINPPPFGFPSTTLPDGQATSFVIDNTLVRPYSIQFNLSIQRELPNGFVVDVGYVGRLGRRLLAKVDLGQPLNFTDPVSGQSLWDAYGVMAGLIESGLTINDIASVPEVPWFNNVWSNLITTIGTSGSGFDRFCGSFNGAGTTPSQMVFCMLEQGFYPSYSDLTFRFDVSRPVFRGLSPYAGNLLGGPSDGFVIFTSQFASLPAWRNWGSSNYHGLQISARRRAASGLTVDLNYTLSKSIDNGSALENSSRTGGQIPNAFNPRENRAVSAFDLRHNFNGGLVYDLPFGRGRQMGGDVSGWVDQIIGGWRINSLVRWRSGFATGIGNGFNFPTNFWRTGLGSFTSNPGSSNVSSDENGNGPNLFGDPAGVLDKFIFSRAGIAGPRNFFRTDQFLTFDTGLAKTFNMPMEGHTVTFRWETFNITNSQFFSDNSLRLSPTSPSTFGQFRGISGNPRIMQFALRYDF